MFFFCFWCATGLTCCATQPVVQNVTVFNILLSTEKFGILCVGHTSELCKIGWTAQVYRFDGQGSRNHALYRRFRSLIKGTFKGWRCSFCQITLVTCIQTAYYTLLLLYTSLNPRRLADGYVRAPVIRLRRWQHDEHRCLLSALEFRWQHSFRCKQAINTWLVFLLLMTMQASQSHPVFHRGVK